MPLGAMPTSDGYGKQSDMQASMQRQTIDASPDQPGNNGKSPGGTGFRWRSFHGMPEVSWRSFGIMWRSSGSGERGLTGAGAQIR